MLSKELQQRALEHQALATRDKRYRIEGETPGVTRTQVVGRKDNLRDAEQIAKDFIADGLGRNVVVLDTQDNDRVIFRSNSVE